MPTLSAWFENFLFGENSKQKIEGPSKTVTVIGSGGKTSLIWHLASALSAKKTPAEKILADENLIPKRRKILVTPAAKMFVPLAEEKLYDRYCDYRNGSAGDNVGGNAAVEEPLSGVTLAGVFNKASGKLESMPFESLEKISRKYDLVLIEGDGSRGLPLKAWTPEEPVVPPFTELTIGVLPLWPLGKPASESLIHRLPLFLELTGAAPGEIIKSEHILHLITGANSERQGLFAKARGKKVLFFSQIENESALEQAKEIVSLLPAQFNKNLSAIIAGSVKRNLITECYALST